MSGCEVYFRNSHVHALNLQCLLCTFSRMFHIFGLTKYLTSYNKFTYVSIMISWACVKFCLITAALGFLFVRSEDQLHILCLYGT